MMASTRGCYRDTGVPQELPDAVDPNNAAGACASPDLVVEDVAAMLRVAGVGMRKDNQGTRRPFSLGGLWESWEDRTSGKKIEIYTITTMPNEVHGVIHNRMAQAPHPSAPAYYLSIFPERPSGSSACDHSAAS
jgi:hypothetical protein